MGAGHEGDIKFVNDASMTWKDKMEEIILIMIIKNLNQYLRSNIMDKNLVHIMQPAKKITWTIAAKFQSTRIKQCLNN